MTAPLCCPEPIRNTTQGGRDASSSLPNQGANTAKHIHNRLQCHWVMSRRLLGSPAIFSQSYLSRAARGRPVWGLVFAMRSGRQRQKKMTLSFKPVNKACVKARVSALFKWSALKPLPPAQSELRTGTEIDNAKVIRVEG